MDNITTFRIELDVAAQKVIHQFMTHNTHVEDQIRSAIQKTVEGFDFEGEIIRIATEQLRKALREAMMYSNLESKVREVTDKIYQELIEKELSKYKRYE
jgi:hypothetical protein